jgi:hypothetical protein
MPDFFGTTKRVLDRLAQQPVTVTVDSQTVLVSKEDVQTVIAIQSGEQAFVRRLPALVGQMDAGNFVLMARMVREVIKNRPFGTVMTYMTDLASGVSDERARKIREQVPGALLGNAINFHSTILTFRLCGRAGSRPPVPRANSLRCPDAVHQRHARRTHLAWRC